MAVEKEIEIGRNLVNVGLDFDFGFLLLGKRFGFDLEDFNKLSGGVSAMELASFLGKIVQAAHVYFCEQCDEPIVLNNQAKVNKFISTIGIEQISIWVQESMESFAPPVASPQDSDEKKAQ